MKNQTVAAIDIGSNSIKLSIVQAAASDSFTVILQERERVRLGETLLERMITSDAMQRAVETIARFKSIAENRSSDRILAVATASVREAENSAEFIAEVEKKTGVKVEIISAVEEARLIGIAATNYFHKTKGSLLNIDIGGGSTELSLMKDSMPELLLSMKIGSLSLRKKYLTSDPPKKKELKQLCDEIKFALIRPVREISGKAWEMVSGTSGTILNLAHLIDPSRKQLTLKKLINLNAKLVKMTDEQRATLPSISLSRAETIVSGGQILEHIMRELKIQTLYPCGYALREGVIIDYLRKVEAEGLPPVPDVEDPRLKGIFAIGRRYGYEEKHALQVATIAEKIFDQLTSLHKLSRHERTILSAAALLHNIGYYVSHEAHHKHSLYLIKHSEIIGFSEREKLIIANVARYHRGKLPNDKHPDFMVLDEQGRELIWKLGGILRLANALDRSYESKIKDVRIYHEKRKVTMELTTTEENPLEIQAVNQRKDMFEKAFNCELVISTTLLQAATSK